MNITKGPGGQGRYKVLLLMNPYLVSEDYVLAFTSSVI